MRILVFLLLFQFIAPTFFSVVTLGAAPGDVRTALAPSHSSIVVPIFLKEQEERDHDEIQFRPLDLSFPIDFSNHSLTHTASQVLILKRSVQYFSYQPPLFRLNCTLLI